MCARRGCPITVGRDAEFARLREIWQDAVAGVPSLVVLLGEAGIGKSRLLDDLADQAQAEAGLVLVGGCSPLLEGSAPYSPIREALEPLCRDDQALPPALQVNLTNQLFPTSSDVQKSGVLPDRGSGELFAAVRSALQAAAGRQPVLLAVEDVHWADVSTLQVLAALDRMLRRFNGETRLMIAVTCRPEMAASAHGAVLIHELRRSPVAEVVDLGPVDASAVSEMLQALQGSGISAAHLAAVTSRADGNPYLIEELAADGGAVIPDGIREMLSLRLARLPAGVTEVLRAASMLGRTIDLDVLAEITDCPPQELQSAVRAALDGGALVTAGGQYLFRHALLQEFLASQLLSTERRDLHARAAHALISRPEQGADASIVAYHFTQAGDHRQAVIWSLRAAAEAQRLNALPEEFAHYERVLRLLSNDKALQQNTHDLADIYHRAGVAAAGLGSQEQAAELLGQAALLFAQSGKSLEHARTLGEAGFALSHFDLIAALKACDEAYALLTDAPPSEAVAIAMGGTGTALLYVGRPAEAIPRLRRAAEMSTEVDSRMAEAITAIGYGAALNAVGDRELGLACLREALVTLRERKHPYFNLCALQLTMGLRWSGRLQEAIHTAAEALEVAASWGADQYWWCAGMRAIMGWCAYKLGQWDHPAIQLSRSYAITGREFLRPWSAIGVHLGRGELGLAADLLALAEKSTRVGPEFIRLHLEQVAELAVLEGRSEDALAAVRQGVASVAGTTAEARSGRLLLLGVRAAALEAAPEKRLRELQALAASLPTGPWGAQASPHILTSDAVRSQWQAECARTSGMDDDGLWAAAAEQWRQLSRPQPYAYCLLRAASGGITANRPRAVLVKILAEVQAIAHELRAAPMQTEIRSLANRAGVRLSAPSDAPRLVIPEQGSENLYGLTAREREVLQLVTAGKTNSQLAHELFISIHTANVHVSRILAKLGVSNRTEAANLAFSVGLAGSPTPARPPVAPLGGPA